MNLIEQNILSKYIHIDSRRRNQEKGFHNNSDLNIIKLSNENPLFFNNNSYNLIIYDNNHNLKKKDEIYLTNIEADENGLICNFPKNKLEYNPLTGKPVLEIKSIDTLGNYYTVSLPNDENNNPYIDKSNIKTGRVGGSKIIRHKVGYTNLKLYNSASNYSLILDREIKNVVAMRLISTEIPNVSYNIRNNGTQKNNCIYFVNENEGRYISDKIAVSDTIYLNSINKSNLINPDVSGLTSYPDASPFQHKISSKVSDYINTSYSNVSDYVNLTKNKLSKFYTPPDLFNKNNFLDNNYHVVGDTLLNYIRTNTSEHTKFKKYLPWEFNYYLKYHNGSNYATDINYIPNIIGYQIFDINSSKLNNLKFQEYITNSTYNFNNIIPINNINGGSFHIQNIKSIYDFTNTLTLKYPIHSIYLDEGLYNNIDDILKSLNNKLNLEKSLTYSWKLRDWISNNKSKKFNSKKNNSFDIVLNKQNEIIQFKQYQDISNYSSLYNKPINENNDKIGKNLTIFTNEGLSEISIKNKGHIINTGNLLKLNVENDVYNITSDSINQEHIIKINPVYKIQIRVIFPVLSELYYGIRKNITNENYQAYLINQDNLGREFNSEYPDTTKILKDYLGEDNFKYLNKGTFKSMLKYIGSKLVNSNVEKTMGEGMGGPTDNKNQVTHKKSLTIEGPENPFIKNELIARYEDLQSFDNTIILGRINSKTRTDKNGNVSLIYECISQIEHGNFTVGDFIVGMESNAIGMIVPYNYSDIKLPSKLDLISRIQWKKQIRLQDENIVAGLSTDKNGNIYLMGHIEGEFSTPTDTNSNKDIIFAKYNSSGKLIWYQQIGPTDTDNAHSITTDDDGNLYLLGTSEGVITGSNAGNKDIYIAKYNTDGTNVWQAQIGTTGIDVGYSIKIDSSKNVFLVGSSNADFDDTGSEVHHGNLDIIVVKYNSSGVQQWIKQYGTSQNDIGYSLAIDYLDNIFITGTSNNGSDEDIILRKINNSNGTLLWSINLSSTGSNNDYGYGIVTDNLGYVYVCGYTAGNLISSLTGFANDDIFIVKYSTNGKLVWKRQFGTLQNDQIIYSSSLAVDNFHNIYLCGHTLGSLDINNSDNTKNDVFLMKLNKDGEELWTEQIGKSEDEKNVNITIDNFSNLYLSGITKSNLAIETNVSKLGSEYDIFLFKLFTEEHYPIQKIENGSENIIIQTDKPLTITNIDGLDNNLSLHKPIKFSMLWGKENTLREELGFKNNKQGKLSQEQKYVEELQFSYVSENTKKINESIVKRSTFFNFYNDIENNYIMIETQNNIDNFINIGDTIYLENHSIKYNQQKEKKYRQSIIKSVYPFKDWLYSLETESEEFDSSIDSPAVIENIKKWLYNNISKWTNNDVTLLDKILNNYYYSSSKVYKIYVRETNGDGLKSKIFQPNMSIYDSAVLMGKVLGITKMNTTTDKVYNETIIQDIEDIKKNDYYIIYFERDDSYATTFTGFADGDTITFDKNVKALASTGNVNTTTHIITINSHGFVQDEMVTYTKIGSNEIGGLSDNNSYFILYEDANTFKLSLTNGGDAIELTSQPDGLDTFHRSITREASATVALFPNPPYSSTPLYVDARYDYLYYFYFANKVIIDYKTDFSKQELEYLGNHGYLGNNGIDLNKDIDYNYTILPLNTIDSGEYVYIHNHQKAVPKYFSEEDVIDDNEQLIETIENDFDKSIAKTSVDNQNNYDITGIPDGCYKSLINLWPGSISTPYYLSKKYRPGKTILLDLDWNNEIEKGYMNKGNLRTLQDSISIAGDNKQIENKSDISSTIASDDTKNKKDQKLLKLAVNSSLNQVTALSNSEVALSSGSITNGTYAFSQSYTSGIGEGFTCSVTFESNESTAITITNGGYNYAVGDTISFVNNNSEVNVFTITVNTIGATSLVGNGFKVGSILFINTNTFTENVVSEYATKINEDTCEMNIIDSITDDTITLKYNLINNHNANSLVIQRYTTSFVMLQTTSSSNQVKIVQADFNNFSVGDIVILDWNTKDANGNFLEERHKIASKSGSDILVLEQNLNKIHTTNCCVVNMGSSLINETMLSTQNILINNEWYTKVFYQGPDCIEPDGTNEYKTGVSCFHKYSKDEIYINGMSGIQIPNMSLMINRDSAYSGINDIQNTNLDSAIEEYFDIPQIKPFVDGFYNTHPNLLDDNYNLLTDYYNIQIPGYFTKINKNFSNEKIWNETTSYDSNYNREYNCILIKGKYLGYGGKIEFREKTSILNNQNGFKVLQKIKEPNSNEVKKIIIDLKLSNINLHSNMKNLNKDEKVKNNLIYNNNVPSSVLINNYNNLIDKNYIKNDISIGTGGILCKKVKNDSINLNGENYVNLCIDNLVNTSSQENTNIIDLNYNDKQKNIFAKILFPENSGNVLFNTFVSAPKIFKDPIDLEKLDIKFVDYNGNEYDFQDKDHSFTLEVFFNNFRPKNNLELKKDLKQL